VLVLLGRAPVVSLVEGAVVQAAVEVVDVVQQAGEAEDVVVEEDAVEEVEGVVVAEVGLRVSMSWPTYMIDAFGSRYHLIIARSISYQREDEL
jgi:hypothetical protein